MRSLKFIVPLVVFLGLAAFLAVGLTRDPREIPSPFIGKAAPGFKLEQLADEKLAFTPDEMKGKVWLLNVWASWCVACRVEHPLLVQMSKQKTVPIVGLNYKDKRDEGLQWLRKHGDPYSLSAYDVEGRVGIDYGVYLFRQGRAEEAIVPLDAAARRHPDSFRAQLELGCVQLALDRLDEAAAHLQRAVASSRRAEQARLRACPCGGRARNEG